MNRVPCGAKFSASIRPPKEVTRPCTTLSPRPVPPESALVARLLTHERLQRARALGSAIRLACDLSGRNAELLARTRLEVKSANVVLEAEEAYAPILLGEQTAKRAGTLASLLERDLKLRAASRQRARQETAA